MPPSDGRLVGTRQTVPRVKANAAACTSCAWTPQLKLVSHNDRRAYTGRMDCPTDDTLAVYFAGDATLGRGDQLRAHLGSCQACHDLAIALARRTPGPLELDATSLRPKAWPMVTPQPLDVPDFPTLPVIDPDQ